MGEIIERLLGRERLLPRPRDLLMAQMRPEDIVQEWRKRGVPETAIALAMKMADNWLRKVTK